MNKDKIINRIEYIKSIIESYQELETEQYEELNEEFNDLIKMVNQLK